MNTRTEPTRFDPDQLIPFLLGLECSGRWVVAFSGGADSTALLHAMHSVAHHLPGEVVAMHVHHATHPDADLWEEHCQHLCDDLGRVLQVHHVHPTGDSGEGLEAELRRLRYAAFLKHMQRGDVLLTAHHRQDQAETVLLHLTRGSGPDGLAAMHTVRPLRHVRLARPLLEQDRADLRAYLRARNIPWIEDSSNQDLKQDRNLLRQKILPLLRERWPAIDASISRSAEHARESSHLQAEYADQWLDKVLHRDRILDLAPLHGQESALFKLVLRRWFKRQGLDPVPRARLEEFCRQLREARTDSSTRLTWSDHRIDLYQDKLWLRPARDLQPCPRLSWTGQNTLELGAQVGVMSLVGAPTQRLPADTSVGPRQGGDTLVLRSSGHHHRVKDLLREAGIPPWLRSSIPVLRGGGRVLAVGDWLVSEHFLSSLEANGTRLDWSPRDPQLKWIQTEVHDARLATGRWLG